MVLTDVKAAKVADAARRLADEGAEAISVAVDVGDGAQVAAMIDTARAAFGSIDVLVNNAGGSGDQRSTEIEEVSEEAWDGVIDANLKGTFLCCKAVMGGMKAQGYGRIVNISSGLAKGIGNPQGTAGAALPYAAAKAGILGFTYFLAKTAARHGILVNAVLPGLMLTEPGARVRDWFDGLSEEAKAQVLARNAMGRAGAPEELASIVLFLASEECGFVSGAAIDVHGAG